MADWYCSSASYAAIAAFVPSAVYSVGQIVKPTAPALKAMWTFRCTTAGTAGTEPAWPSGNTATATTGGVTFTNVTGQSAYGWTAAAGDVPSLIATRFAVGDRMFVSSDHTETQSSTTDYGTVGGPSYTLGQILSVNRAGSVPPVAADLLAGASVTVTGGNNFNFSQGTPLYYYGISFIYTGSFVVSFQFGSSGAKTLYFDACQFYWNTATACRMQAATLANVVWNNTTLRFGNAGQSIQSTNYLEITWLNTPSAILGTPPTTLFNPPSAGYSLVLARGVDLSAITGTLFTTTTTGVSKVLLDSCRIAPGVVRYVATGAATNTREIVELVNCFDGTNFISESYQPSGAVTTELTITLTGGATDNVGTFAHKMVSNANVDKYVAPLTSFWMDVNNTAIGSSKTATLEIISSGSVNNDEISLVVEYLGTASSSLASMATSLPATVLTAASAVTTSTATWNASPATPVKQKLQVTFTPRTAGRVRAQVRLGKASTTVYVNPQVTIT